MTIKVYDPRGVLIDIYQFVVVPTVSDLVAETKGTTPWAYTQSGNILTAKSGAVKVQFNIATGDIEQVDNNGKNLWTASARLMVLPLTGEGNGTQMRGDNKTFEPFTNVCKNRIVTDIKLNKAKNAFTVNLTDDYSEAGGTISYTFLANGTVKIGYKYVVKKDVNPRQWGLVFSLPNTFQELQ